MGIMAFQWVVPKYWGANHQGKGQEAGENTDHTGGFPGNMWSR